MGMPRSPKASPTATAVNGATTSRPMLACNEMPEVSSTERTSKVAPAQISAMGSAMLAM